MSCSTARTASCPPRAHQKTSPPEHDSQLRCLSVPLCLPGVPAQWQHFLPIYPRVCEGFLALAVRHEKTAPKRDPAFSKFLLRAEPQGRWGRRALRSHVRSGNGHRGELLAPGNTLHGTVRPNQAAGVSGTPSGLRASPRPSSRLLASPIRVAWTRDSNLTAQSSKARRNWWSEPEANALPGPRGPDGRFPFTGSTARRVREGTDQTSQCSCRGAVQPRGAVCGRSSLASSRF